MLKEYSGPSNSQEIYQHLVGERIKAVIQDGAYLYLIVGYDYALVLTSFGGEVSPSFWVADPDKVRELVLKRKNDLKNTLRLLENATAIKD